MLECIVVVDPSVSSSRGTIGPDDVGYEPLHHPKGSFLVIANQRSWKNPTKLSRGLSRTFSAVRRVRTFRDDDALHYIGIGGDELQDTVEYLEARGPGSTQVTTLLEREGSLFTRVLTPSKDWLADGQTPEVDLLTARVYAPRWTEVDFLQHGLSEAEVEVAQKAIRNDYYDKPRGCTMSDLAEELGISKSAVYHRLNSFERKMIERTRDLDLTATLIEQEA